MPRISDVQLVEKFFKSRVSPHLPTCSLSFYTSAYAPQVSRRTHRKDVDKLLGLREQMQAEVSKVRKELKGKLTTERLEGLFDKFNYGDCIVISLYISKILEESPEVQRLLPQALLFFLDPLFFETLKALTSGIKVEEMSYKRLEKLKSKVLNERFKALEEIIIKKIMEDIITTGKVNSLEELTSLVLEVMGAKKEMFEELLSELSKVGVVHIVNLVDLPKRLRERLGSELYFVLEKGFPETRGAIFLDGWIKPGGEVFTYEEVKEKYGPMHDEFSNSVHVLAAPKSPIGLLVLTL